VKHDSEMGSGCMINLLFIIIIIINVLLRSAQAFMQYFHNFSVTIDGVWIGDWIY
jgi:hypothetical protein